MSDDKLLPKIEAESTLFERILWVRRQVGYLQRDTQIKEMGGYKALSYEKLVAYIKPLLDSAGLLFSISEHHNSLEAIPTKSGGSYRLYCAVFECSLIDVHNPKLSDRFFAYIPGHGVDAMDKAPGKAMSYAAKSFLRHTFLVQTGDNEESQFIGAIDQDVQEGELEGLIDQAKKLTTKSDLREFFLAHYKNFTAGRRIRFKRICTELSNNLPDEEGEKDA